MNAMNAVLIIFLLLLISLAVVTAARKMRRGGGCCGEHEAVEKKVAAADRNKSHYPWAATLGIGGMTCENCSRKVENALNTLKGTWASVSISSHSARVLCKEEPDEALLREAVRGAGYVVTSCQIRRV
jgi:copper chaperone CopZ